MSQVSKASSDSLHPRVLIVDDHPANIALLRSAIAGRNFEITTADTAEAARTQFRAVRPDLVLLDLVLPDGNGLDLLTEMQRLNPGADVILITAHYSTDSAVEAIQKGAYDYITKPLQIVGLLNRLDRWMEEYRQRTRAAALESELLRVSAMEGIIGRSPQVLELFSKLRRIAPHFETVLVNGETGTGKEMVARALHALSKRPGPLVVCNCAAVSESLFESELFGHEKGAFTGAFQARKGLVEAAERGTLFLDEIAEIPLPSQAKLLRLLQNREIQKVGSPHTQRVDLRIVAATHRDVPQLVRERLFREDLFYRLSAVQVSLPRLADRMEDLPLLEAHFLELLAERFQKPALALSRRAQAVLAQHHWPGNIRELENVLRYAAMLAEGETIDVSDLPESLQPSRSVETEQQSLWNLQEVIYQHAQRALEHCDGNRARAAEMIGIGRATLYRLLAKHSK
jgi:DNA-binding NtrC family response regulator